MNSLLTRSMVLAAFTTAAMLAGVSNASAKTVTYCSSSGSGCFYAKMPLFNQNSSALSDLFPSGDPNQSMLCGPTAAAMALAALTLDGLTYYSDSWTDKKFVYQSEENRIRAFASKMGTHITNGTTQISEKFSDRQADIKRATGNVDYASTRVLDDARIKELIDRHEVDIVIRGSYDRSCAKTAMDGYICMYERTSGHAMAVNGSFTEDGKRFTRIYDPWYAQVYSRNIVETSDPSYSLLGGLKIPLDPRPFNGHTRELSHSGNTYKIVEKVGGINTND